MALRKSLVLGLVLFSSFAHAQKMGVGAMVGNPTGLNGKYWLGDTTALDAGLGVSLGGKSRVSLHSDYLFHSEAALYFKDNHPLDLYYGIGGRMKFSDDIQLGVRVPVGVAYLVGEKNADMFGEVAPVLDFIGRTGLDLNLLLGARYYF